MKTLSANHLSLVAGGISEEPTIAIPGLTIDVETTESEESKWAQYIPSLRTVGIFAAGAAIALLAAWGLNRKA